MPLLINLPTELLKIILRFATGSRTASNLDKYQVLYPGRSEGRCLGADSCPINLRTKLSLTLTSKRMRSEAEEFVYESLRLTPTGVGKICDLCREGRFNARLVKCVVFVFGHWNDSSSEAVQKVAELLRACTGLQGLNISDLYVKDGQDTGRVLWDAIPKCLKRITIRSLDQVSSHMGLQVLRTFLTERKELTCWEIVNIPSQHPPHLLAAHLELLSRIEFLWACDVWGHTSMVESSPSLPLPMVTELKVVLPLLKEVYIVLLNTDDNIAHLICRSPKLISLVCNLRPYKDEDVTVWDTHSNESSLQEITVVMTTLRHASDCPITHAVKRYSDVQDQEGAREGSLKEAQDVAYKLFGGLLKRESFPYLRRIVLFVEVPGLHGEDRRFIEKMFMCLRQTRVEVSVFIDSFGCDL